MSAVNGNYFYLHAAAAEKKRGQTLGGHHRQESFKSKGGQHPPPSPSPPSPLQPSSYLYCESGPRASYARALSVEPSLVRFGGRLAVH